MVDLEGLPNECTGVTDRCDPSELGPRVNISDNPNEIIKLSRRRWAILFALSLFGMNMCATGDLSCILHTMLKLLELPLDSYVYFLQFFYYLPAISTVPTAWLINRYGIRLTMYGATFLMLISNASKALLFNPELPRWEELKFYYWIVTNILGTQALITFFLMPLKVSENWFATSERSIAWTILMSSMSIGTSVAAFSLPRFIHNVEDVKPLFYVNIVSPLICGVAIFSCITRSKPKHPPSERMRKSLYEEISYIDSIKNTFKNKDIMLHLIHEAIFEGVFIASSTVIQDILVAAGHSEVFVGNIISFNAIFTVIMIITLSRFVHRVQNIKAACKIASSLRTITFILYLLTMLNSVPEWVIVVFSSVYCTSRSWTSPTLTNMTAHLASRFVSEATVAGILVMAIVLTTTVSQISFVKLITISGGKSDYTNSITCASIACVINSLVYIIFFKARAPTRSDSDDEVIIPSD